MNAGDGIQIGVGVVLALTLVAVVWYGWQARKQAEASARMAEEMREQRLLTTRPILLLSPVAQEAGTGTAEEGLRLALPGPLPDTTPVRIINIGPGMAVEIRVPCKLAAESPHEAMIDYLSCGSEKVVPVFYLAAEQGDSSQRILRITYQDVFGNRYESTREFRKEPDSQDYVFAPLVYRELPRTPSAWRRQGMESRKGNGPEGRAGR
jgi:hypothetical protein